MTPAGPSLGPALSGARPHGPPGMDHGHPVHQDPHPSVPPNSEADSAKGHVDSRSSPYRHSIRRYLTFFVARVSSLPPERKANALIFLSALLVLGRGAGELAFLRSQDRVKSANSRTRSASSVPDLMLSSHWLVQFDLQRRKKVGRALLISAHGLSSIRMALVLAEWIEHAYHAVKHKPQEHKKQEAGPEAEEDEGICSRFGEALGWGAEALEMGAFVGSALALVVRYHHSSRTGRRWHHVLDHWAEQAERGSIWLAALALPPLWAMTLYHARKHSLQQDWNARTLIWETISLAGETASVGVELTEHVPARWLPRAWRRSDVRMEWVRDTTVAALAAFSASVRLAALP